MKTNNYPDWLVPLELAKELKEIGFDEPCNHYVRISNDDIKLKINHSSIGLVILKRNSEYLNDDIASFVTIPTWEQVFEWFREKGFRITLINYEDVSKFSFFNMKIKGGVYYAGAFYTYEEARKELVNKLIEVYGNNI